MSNDSNREHAAGVGISSPPLVVVTVEQLACLIRRAVADVLAEQEQDMSPVLLDRARAARKLGVGVATVDRFRRQGMPCVYLGDSPRFEVAACVVWLREHCARGAANFAGDVEQPPPE